MSTTWKVRELVLRAIARALRALAVEACQNLARASIEALISHDIYRPDLVWFACRAALPQIPIANCSQLPSPTRGTRKPMEAFVYRRQLSGLDISAHCHNTAERFDCLQCRHYGEWHFFCAARLECNSSLSIADPAIVG